jgi:hypothetical protein
LPVLALFAAANPDHIPAAVDVRHFKVRYLDLLQMGFGGGEGLAVFSLELRRDAKKVVDDAPLPDHIALRQPLCPFRIRCIAS